ncbi:MAG TPA: DUF2877 domain-containing protein [Candidatus Acetothermia bacterium]|nr:DUF2877 domain-containing protein [Candidatus Acetothermia bacterium]
MFALAGTETIIGLTFATSAQTLLAASDRSFTEPIFALLIGLTPAGISEDGLLEKAKRVARLGHHSGLAILSGLAGSLRLLRLPMLHGNT